MRNFLFIIIMLHSCFLSTAQVTNSKTVRPNIIYILADDLGYGDLGCYGQKQIRTPHLDKLAASGMLFTQHYAGAPVCAPSRAVFMTGRDPGHARVRGNYENGAKGFGSGLELRDEDITIAEILKPAGYQTAVIGKWGMGVEGTTGLPNKQGFDYSYGFLNQGHAHYQYPDYLFRNGERIDVAENMNGKQGGYSNDLFTGEALKFMQQTKEAPFFLYLAYTTPHAELLVPNDTIFNSYKGRFTETPYVSNAQGGGAKSNFGAYGSQAYPNAAYAACITHLDMSVGRIISYLEKNNMLENTIIFFSSDNGPAKEGGANPAYFNSNGSLRGIKRDVYEGGIRVPFIASWKGKIAAGSTNDFISGFQDMLPTMAHVAGLESDAMCKTEGINMLPVLTGNADQQLQHPYLYWEFHEGPTTTQALRMGKWKYVRQAPDTLPELYNLNNDVAERNNVAASHADVVAIMTNLVNNARTPHEIWPLKTLAGVKEKKAKNQRQTNPAAKTVN